MKRVPLIWGLVPALAWICWAGGVGAADEKAGVAARIISTNGSGAIELMGRIMPRRAGTNHIAFQTEDGLILSLPRNQKSEALFADTNLWAKTLLLKGRLQPPKGLFEVTGNLHSLRDGKTNELYYWCNICSIKTSDPGPCLCCREPVELVEKPE